MEHENSNNQILKKEKRESAKVFAQLFTESTLEIAIASGHEHEFLNLLKPQFSLRPLWIQSEVQIKISSDLSIFLPLLFNSENYELYAKVMAKRIVELGYNSVIFGNYNNVNKYTITNISIVLQKIIDIFEYFGIIVILKPLIHLDIIKCILDSKSSQILSSIQTLSASTPKLKYLFWESAIAYSDSALGLHACDMTNAEFVLQEIRLFERSLSEECALIFYLPTANIAQANSQAVWLPDLLDDVGNKTVIAFAFVAGDPKLDYLPLHPFWKSLRTSPDCSSTPLMPIVNIGGVSQGEGLWPSIPLDLIEESLNRCKRHSFLGIIALTTQIPKKGSLLDCTLWVASQKMWRNIESNLLLETWFLAYHPRLEYSNYNKIIPSIREIAIELSRLRSFTNEKSRDTLSHEECRTFADTLLHQLKLINDRLRKLSHVPLNTIQRPLLLDYFTIFIRDARRMILHFLQCYNVPMGNILEGSDLQDGFWTHISHGIGQGIRSANKVTFLDTPSIGAPGSVMEKIYLENRLE